MYINISTYLKLCLESIVFFFSLQIIVEQIVLIMYDHSQFWNCIRVYIIITFITTGKLGRANISSSVFWRTEHRFREVNWLACPYTG